MQCTDGLRWNRCSYLALVSVIALAVVRCGGSDPEGTDGVATAGDAETTAEAETTTGDAETTPEAETTSTEATSSEVSDRILVSGAVQKGPFVVGSAVQVAPLTEDFQPTGVVYSTETTNDLGEFEVELHDTAVCQVTAMGFYYNEITGALSGAPLTLRALFRPSASGAQNVYVNLITHLTKLRVQTLVKSGETFEAATPQAERELRIALAIAPADFDPGRPAIETNIAGGDDKANAYLLTVSSVLTKVAQARGAASIDANLQELTNTIALDFADDGDISAALKAEIAAVLKTFDPVPVEEALAKRLADTGSSATVPTMAQALDQDQDGRTNSDDLCPNVPTESDNDADADGIGDQCDPCPQTRCADGEVCVPGDARHPPTTDACFRPCDGAVPALSCAETEVCSGVGLALDPTKIQCRDDADCRGAGAYNSHCTSDGTCACDMGQQCGGLSYALAVCMCTPTAPGSCGSDKLCVPRKDVTTPERAPIFHCVPTPTPAPPAPGDPCDPEADVACGDGALCLNVTADAPTTCGRVCRMSPDFDDCPADEVCQRLPAPVGGTAYGTCGAAGCPTAVITVQEGDEVIPQTKLHLIGSNSYPTSGTIQSYRWRVEQPPGSASRFFPADNIADPTFEANIVGTYRFELTVTDALGSESCVAAMAQVLVIANEAIHVELLWNTPEDLDQSDEGPVAGADLDLHFTHPSAKGPDLDLDGTPDKWFHDLFDCFWSNDHPNWGSPDFEIDDNPGLDRDDTDGAGPETVNLNQPENVCYDVGVHYWADHGFGKSFGTVRVYLFGNLAFEVSNVELVAHDVWWVTSLCWPPAGIVPTAKRVCAGTVQSCESPADCTGGRACGLHITPNYVNPNFPTP